MFRKALKIISMLMILCLNIACIAFADVPSIAKRPMPVPGSNQYWVYNESFYSSYGEGKCAVILTYKAPLGSEVQYELNDDAGNLITKGVEKSEKYGGQITLTFATPPAGNTQVLHFNSSCYVTMIKTSYGMKRMNNPRYIDSWKSSYIVKTTQDGNVEIDSVN